MLMIKYVLIIVAFLSVNSFAQTGNNLLDKASHYYMNDQYDSAIFYYKILAGTASPRSSYYFNQLGDCYFNIGNYEESERNYLLCLKEADSSKYLYSPKRHSCLGIADLNIKLGKFDKALEFLQLAEKSHPHHRICSAGEFERKVDLARKFSLCFENLNLIDSAISHLTPYMFVETEWIRMDSSTYINISNYYVSLLKKKYSKESLKSILTCAIDALYYKKQSAKERGDKFTFRDMYYVDCYFTFLGSKVILEDGGYEATSWGGEPVLYFTKGYLLEQLYKSPTYKSIMN